MHALDAPVTWFDTAEPHGMPPLERLVAWKPRTLLDPPGRLLNCPDEAPVPVLVFSMTQHVLDGMLLHVAYAPAPQPSCVKAVMLVARAEPERAEKR